MTRLPALKPAQIIKVLERAGFELIRQKGSHALYRRSSVSVTIPIHKKDLKPGTLHAIIKQSGLTSEEFKKSLK